MGVAFCSVAAMRTAHGPFCARAATMPPVMAIARAPRYSSSRAMNAILQDIVDAVAFTTSTNRSKVLLQLATAGTTPTSSVLDGYLAGLDLAQTNALKIFAIFL